jgi:hypothetical protein
MREGSA